MIIDTIKKAFGLWRKNFIIVVPFVFQAVITLILLSVLFLVLLVSLGMDLMSLANLASFKAIDFSGFVNALASSSEMMRLPSVIASTLIIGIIILFIIAYFNSGALGMAKEITARKKVSLGTMHKYGKKFLLRRFAVGLIIALIFIIYFLLLALPFFISKKMPLVLIPMVGLIPAFFLYLFFALSAYFLIYKDTSSLEAIKASCSFVKKKYCAFLGLFILFMLMNFVARVIPFIGGLISLLVVMPSMAIALMFFIRRINL